MIDFSADTVHDCGFPNRALMGDGVSAKIPDLLAEWGVTGGSVLFVVDKEIVKLDLHQTALKALKEKGYGVEVFDEITTEPQLETAEALVTLSRDNPYGAVIGFGGGSAMDLAKLAAALSVNTGKVTDYIGPVIFKNAPLPLIAVPTTAGTGSEATAVSMLSVEGKKAIMVGKQFIPKAALIDPKLTMSLPGKITAATGMDALSHALEGFMSVKASPFTDPFALTCTLTIRDYLKRAYDNGADAEARRAMGYAAFLGGICLNAGVVIGHSIAYTIANRMHVSHGLSCAMSLPYAVAFNIPAMPKRISALAVQVTGETDADPGGLAVWVDELNARLDIPRTLPEVGISESDLPDMVEECLNRYPRPTNPREITRKRLEVMYRHMFTGDVTGCVDALA
jgi:alcohol dehydrogenase class IV